MILLATATIEMPDEQTAIDLRRLLDESVSGKIIQLTPKIGRYSRFDFTHARFCTTRNGATVISVDAKPVGRTFGAAILDFILSNALPGC